MKTLYYFMILILASCNQQEQNKDLVVLEIVPTNSCDYNLDYERLWQ